MKNLSLCYFFLCVFLASASPSGSPVHQQKSNAHMENEDDEDHSYQNATVIMSSTAALTNGNANPEKVEKIEALTTTTTVTTTKTTTETPTANQSNSDDEFMPDKNATESESLSNNRASSVINNNNHNNNNLNNINNNSSSNNNKPSNNVINNNKMEELYDIPVGKSRHLYYAPFSFYFSYYLFISVFWLENVFYHLTGCKKKSKIKIFKFTEGHYIAKLFTLRVKSPLYLTVFLNFCTKNHNNSPI